MNVPVDIVTRTYERADGEGNALTALILHQAADEIQRLRVVISDGERDELDARVALQSRINALEEELAHQRNVADRAGEYAGPRIEMLRKLMEAVAAYTKAVFVGEPCDRPMHEMRRLAADADALLNDHPPGTDTEPEYEIGHPRLGDDPEADKAWLERALEKQGDADEPAAGGGSLPSCLCCGKLGKAAVWLADHPGVYVCVECKSASANPVHAVDTGYAVVPVIPTEGQWGGLARDVFMWLDMCERNRSGASLLEHLTRLHDEIPAWLMAECEKGHLAKGDRAAIVYRAMVEAVPQPVHSQGIIQPEPICWLRTIDGSPDWGEDCVGDADVVVNGYAKEDGYDAIPLYKGPMPSQDAKQECPNCRWPNVDLVGSEPKEADRASRPRVKVPGTDNQYYVCDPYARTICMLCQSDQSKKPPGCPLRPPAPEPKS